MQVLAPSSCALGPVAASGSLQQDLQSVSTHMLLMRCLAGELVSQQEHKQRTRTWCLGRLLFVCTWSVASAAGLHLILGDSRCRERA